MGFYHPATLVKDAQRHGLRIRPIDVTCSQWGCSLENHLDEIWLRIGLRYVRGLSKPAGEALMQARDLAPFTSIENLAQRVPELTKNNLAMLAEIGALNRICPDQPMHRRDALWQVEKASRPSGPLLKTIVEDDEPSPLQQMRTQERLIADYHGTSLTTGPHPMAYCRENLQAAGVKSAIELKNTPHGRQATIAGCVIARQRPGTAKGLIFMTLEDETGHARVIIMPDFYDQNRNAVLRERFVLVSGKVQNVDTIVHLKAEKIERFENAGIEVPSHNFH